jgi:hypothetical protein
MQLPLWPPGVYPGADDANRIATALSTGRRAEGLLGIGEEWRKPPEVGGMRGDRRAALVVRRRGGAWQPGSSVVALFPFRVHVQTAEEEGDQTDPQQDV